MLEAITSGLAALLTPQAILFMFIGVVYGLVIGILLAKYEPGFAVIALVTLACYITFTVLVTNWRTQIRREANELDSAANSRARTARIGSRALREAPTQSSTSRSTAFESPTARCANAEA